MNHLVISPVAQQESNFWNNHGSTLDERNIAVDVILAVSKKETSQASRHHCGIGWFGCFFPRNQCRRWFLFMIVADIGWHLWIFMTPHNLWHLTCLTFIDFVGYLAGSGYLDRSSEVIASAASAGCLAVLLLLHQTQVRLRHAAAIETINRSIVRNKPPNKNRRSENHSNVLICIDTN